MKTLIYIHILCIFLFSCTEKDKSFSDKITILENNPKHFLSQLDTLKTHNIRNEEQATIFLLKELAQYELKENKYLNREKLINCINIFYQKKANDKLLYSFILLANSYEKENNLEKELESINKAIDIAITQENSYWLLFLYNQLSNMYIKQYDFIEFAKCQSIAKRYIDKLNFSSINIKDKILIGKIYIYNNHVDKAIQLLQSVEQDIQKTNYQYPTLKRLLGIAYSVKQDWEHSIEQIELALQYDKEKENLFLYYAILTYCHYKLNNKDKYIQYQSKAVSCKVKNKISFVTSEFCRISAEIAQENKNTEEEVKYLRWLSSIYYEIIRKQNIKTLDEIIGIYDKSFEKKQHAQTVKTYHLTIIAILLLFIVFLIINYHYKKRKLLQFIELQKRITLLEQIEKEKNELKDSTSSLILKDFEVSKQIAILKHTQKEKFERINKELYGLFSVINSNKQLIEWKKFYSHIDISFNHFYSKLIKSYPSLNEKEIQLCCMLKAGFKTNEIAAIWQQSVFSVHKYKTNIRKKVKAPKGANILRFLEGKKQLQA